MREIKKTRQSTCLTTVWCDYLMQAFVLCRNLLPGLGELKVPDGHLGGTAGSLESWHGENHQGKRREIPTATDSACASESGGTQLRLGGAGREWDAWIWDSMVLWPLPSDFVFFPTGGLFAWEDMAIWKPTLELEPIVLKTDGAWIRIDHKDKGELLIGLACPRQSLNMS
jgi:hypothetical protein